VLHEGGHKIGQNVPTIFLRERISIYLLKLIWFIPGESKVMRCVCKRQVRRDANLVRFGGVEVEP
jgi:hypothetical protein